MDRYYHSLDNLELRRSLNFKRNGFSISIGDPIITVTNNLIYYRSGQYSGIQRKTSMINIPREIILKIIRNLLLTIGSKPMWMHLDARSEIVLHSMYIQGSYR